MCDCQNFFSIHCTTQLDVTRVSGVSFNWQNFPSTVIPSRISFSSKFQVKYTSANTFTTVSIRAHTHRHRFALVAFNGVFLLLSVSWNVNVWCRCLYVWLCLHTYGNKRLVCVWVCVYSCDERMFVCAYRNWNTWRVYESPLHRHPYTTVHFGHRI